QKNYGKIKIQSNEVANNFMKGQINKIIAAQLETDGATKIKDDWGRLTYDWKERSKYYNHDKNDPFISWVHPKILDKFLEIYKNKDFKITEVGEKNSTETPKKFQPKAQVLGLEKANWGPKIAFTHNLPYSEWFPLKGEL